MIGYRRLTLFWTHLPVVMHSHSGGASGRARGDTQRWHTAGCRYWKWWFPSLSCRGRPGVEMAPRNGNTKAEWLAEEVAATVNAGKAISLETVDFSDPERPKTCLEVDFPILPVNQIAAIEGNAGKPIYQMSKWWARRRSSVFRSMLIAAAVRAPDDPAEAAKVVWDAYYGNHQKKGAFSQLKVADIFMGGGTTVVEGNRLGMEMYGTDLNPVALVCGQESTFRCEAL